MKKINMVVPYVNVKNVLLSAKYIVNMVIKRIQRLVANSVNVINPQSVLSINVLEKYLIVYMAKLKMNMGVLFVNVKNHRVPKIIVPIFTVHMVEKKVLMAVNFVNVNKKNVLI
jgi:hypothetical protein